MIVAQANVGPVAGKSLLVGTSTVPEDLLVCFNEKIVATPSFSPKKTCRNNPLTNGNR